MAKNDAISWCTRQFQLESIRFRSSEHFLFQNYRSFERLLGQEQKSLRLLSFYFADSAFHKWNLQRLRSRYSSKSSTHFLAALFSKNILQKIKYEFIHNACCKFHRLCRNWRDHRPSSSAGTKFPLLIPKIRLNTKWNLWNKNIIELSWATLSELS